jgi:molybdopterin-guanine dinucleotide biosynthesis protein MobB
MRPVFIAVVGGKKSGKTTTIEILIKKLVERGHKIAAVKHIPEPNFTIDQEGKDTWRYAQAGATEIIGVSAHEVVTIEKTDFKKERLTEILRKCRNNEVVFLEGFKDLIAKNKSIFKIVVLNSESQAAEDLKIFEPILAYTGPYHLKTSGKHPPYVDILKSSGKLADLVEKLILRRPAT